MFTDIVGVPILQYSSRSKNDIELAIMLMTIQTVITGTMAAIYYTRKWKMNSDSLFLRKLDYKNDLKLILHGTSFFYDYFGDFFG